MSTTMRTNVQFDNHNIITLVTCDPLEVLIWVNQTEFSLKFDKGYPKIVGLGVESRPNLNANENNPIATLQLCVGQRCLIFQMLHRLNNEVPESLVNFLKNENYTFVGVGIRDDVDKLLKQYEIEVKKSEDLKKRALEKFPMEEINLKDAGLSELYEHFFKCKLEKSVFDSRSAWDERHLTDNQVIYACVDAYASCKIGRVLWEA